MIKKITDEMFYTLVDLNISEPVPLKDADLDKPFVYDPEFGVFYVPPGVHVIAMATFYCWKHNQLNKFHLLRENSDLKEEIEKSCHGINDTYQYLADKFIDLGRTAMGSSLTSFILTKDLKSLNENEKRCFGNKDVRFTG